MEVFLLFLLGLCVGSFLNVLIDRLPRGESVIKERSYCESCKHTLKWYDLIPLVSFLVLRGKCRYCESPLSYYYPLVEGLTGIMFVTTGLFIINNFQSNLNFQLDKIAALAYYLFIVSSLIVIFFADLKYGIIPDKIVFGAVGITFLFLITNHQSPITYHLFSAIGTFFFFVLIFLATRGRGMGFGDVKFAFLIGLVLSFPKVIVGLYIAFLTGAFVSVILILAGKKKFRGSTVPFGPFLAIGTLTALFWGDILLKTVLPFL